MPERYGSAIVVGASMSGLLAARALSAHFDRVTVVERQSIRSFCTRRTKASGSMREQTCGHFESCGTR